jgi:D-amino-acid oxidase
MARVIVVGAGVVGLTCAVRLLEAGHRVDVVARELPLETTSAIAPAVWLPVAPPPIDDSVRRAFLTKQALEALAASAGQHGVRMLPGTIVGSGSSEERVVPVVDMPVHLRWLVDRLHASGGSLSRLDVHALPAGGTDHADVVVNCAGLGARHLADDRSVTPTAGQVVVVEQFGLERWWADLGVTYIVPREREVVIAGAWEPGEWSRTPSPSAAAAILERAAAFVPAVAQARVLRHKVGLRPDRPRVRLERVGDVVHCYGHGEAGVTQSWGCADEVVSLVGGA